MVFSDNVALNSHKTNNIRQLQKHSLAQGGGGLGGGGITSSSSHRDQRLSDEQATHIIEICVKTEKSDDEDDVSSNNRELVFRVCM